MPESETVAFARRRSRTGGAVLAGLEPGAGFGTRYRILRELGAGGMGIVYQAWDAELGVAVALKIIRPDATDDPIAAQEIEKRFKRELLLARQVTHKNVVRIHDLGEVDGIKYITMPHIEGKDLADVLRERGRLPIPEALRLARQIAAGLAAAHDAGVVHRDLKPENIMIDGDGQPQIMDFGISRSVVSSTATATAAGAIVGTLEYMAPEQARGQAVDQRADLYALGLIVHDMIAGRQRVASSESALTEMMRRMQQPPPPLHTLVPEAPDGLDRVIGKCLKTDPAERYPTTAALVADLEALGADGRAAPVRKERQWNPVTAVLAVLVLVSAGAAIWFWQNRGPAAPAAKPQPIAVLIADFSNNTGNAVFEGALEQALGIAMEGASFVNAYPRSDAQRTAQRLKIGDRLDQNVARQIAFREGIHVLLLGSIVPDGSGYKLTVNAVDPRQPDKPIATRDAKAAGPPDVLPALATLAGAIRTALGDRDIGDARKAFGETMTANSLDAIREYSLAQDLSLRGKDAEAIPHYRLAVEHDPNFGRAYAGWAVSAHSIGQLDVEKQQWEQALKRLDQMTEREKYRTLGGYFLTTVQDYDKAVENFRLLIDKYPADTAGHANLALAYFYLLKFPEALAEGRRAMELNPTSVRASTNYTLYAMYASDFKSAEDQARALIKSDPGFYMPYFPLAAAQIMQGRQAEARDTYAKMSATGAAGASLAAMGLADLALYEGKPAEVEALIAPAIDADRRASANGAAATKLIALAEAHLALGRTADAIAAAASATREARTPDVVVPAARIFIKAGRSADALKIAGDLERELQPQSRAYAKIVRGDAALAAKQFADAVEHYRAAKDLRDIWLARFGLGVAYVESAATGSFALATTELDSSFNRRGEAAAIFLDEMPTFRAVAPLPYWMGRAKTGLGRADATADYRAFLDLRPPDSKDPLAIDARARLKP